LGGLTVVRERQIMNIDISEISTAFPEFTVAVIVASDLTIGEERPPELGKLIAKREAACREEWGGKELSEIPGIAAWRRAYRQFGIKKTSYRSSVERLVKNTLASGALPAINSFVDSYNAVSLTHILPAGADDLDHVAGDIVFRYSREDDSFLDMAGTGQGMVRRSTIRPSRAKSSMPMQKKFYAGDGTGVRTHARWCSHRPTGQSLPSSRTASAISTPPLTISSA
jgi:hypothetical protein